MLSRKQMIPLPKSKIPLQKQKIRPPKKDKLYAKKVKPLRQPIQPKLHPNNFSLILVGYRSIGVGSEPDGALLPVFGESHCFLGYCFAFF